MQVDRNLTGDEAFQRRLALSKASSDLAAAAPSPPTETGEDAYFRRVAMSTQTAPQDDPSFVQPAPPPRQPSPSALAYNPFAPPSVPPPPPPPSGPSLSLAMDDRVKAAAAIAARLGALAAAKAKLTEQEEKSVYFNSTAPILSFNIDQTLSSLRPV